MDKKPQLVLIAAAFICGNLYALPAFGGEMTLRNGDRLTGSLQEIAQGIARFKTQFQSILDVPLSDVSSITTDSDLIFELTTRERVIGRKIRVDEQKLVIDTLGLGEVRIEVGHLANAQLASRAASAKALPDALAANIKGKGAPGSTSAEEKSVEPAKLAPKELGAKPESDDIRRLFMRESNVLLRSGKLALDSGLTYQVAEERIPGLQNIRQREFVLPIQLRYGLNDQVEGFVSLPIVSTGRETNNFSDVSLAHAFDVGDLSLGIKYHAVRESRSWPDVILLGSTGAPTGKVQRTADEVATGSGHRIVSAGIQFVKTLDPAVIFWGGSYSHLYGAKRYFTAPDQYVQPGYAFNYNYGLAFAINDDVSVSGVVNGRYMAEDAVDGSRVKGTSRDLTTLRLGLTSRLTRHTYIEPFITLGVSSQAPDVGIGINVTHNFQR